MTSFLIDNQAKTLLYEGFKKKADQDGIMQNCTAKRLHYRIHLKHLVNVVA